jgi:hypothetical protein
MDKGTMILFSKDAKSEAIDTFDLACKTFLAHGMAKPEFHKISMLIHWMRLQPEDLHVAAKIEADQHAIKFEVIFSFLHMPTDAEAN